LRPYTNGQIALGVAILNKQFLLGFDYEVQEAGCGLIGYAGP